jgi:hypothetical protein
MAKTKTKTETEEVEETEEAPPTPTAEGDAAKRIEALLKAHGDGNGALRALLNERDQAQQQVAELRTKLPKEGSVILSPEDGKSWAAYQALGKPEDLTRTVAERDELRSKVADHEWDRDNTAVAEAAGVKPSVLKTLAKRDRAEFVVKDEPDPKDPAKKKTTKAVFVKGKDDKGSETLTPFDDHAAAHWGDFLPSLKGGATATPTPTPHGSPPSTGQAPPRPPIKPTGADKPRPNALS